MNSLRFLKNLLAIAAELIYRSVFIGDDMESRHVSLFIYLVIAVTEIAIAREGAIGIAIAFVILLMHSLLQGMTEELGYAFILALIPASWYFLTTLPFTGSLIQSAEISLRALAVTTSLTAFLQRINPMEIAYMLRKLGIKESSLYMPLFWKITPHLMRDSEAALMISSLKKEEMWKGLAISFVALEEYNRFYNEGLITKKHVFKPTFWYSTRETLLSTGILACALAALITLTLLP